MLFYFAIAIHKLVNIGFKLSSFLWKILYRLDVFIEALFLSALSPKKKTSFIVKYYSRNKRYVSDKMTLNGPFEWELRVIDAYNFENKKVVIIGAGGGREAYFLAKKGCEVSAYEADKSMVKYMKTFFVKNKVDKVRAEYLPVNTIPSEICDIFWMGWGVYTHIVGRETRINILKQIREIVRHDGLVLISFWRNINNEERSREILKISKRLNFHKVEKGESFRNGLWGKFFTKDEIIEELECAGFSLIYFNEKNYGCALLKPC